MCMNLYETEKCTRPAVMTTEEEIVSNVKIGDKIGDQQTVYFSIETEKESTALE